MSVTFIPNERTRELAGNLATSANRRNALKYQKLHDLGREKYLEIENMLFSGESPSAIATYIQDVWGDLKDIKHVTLKDYIKKFKTERVLPRITMQGKAMEPAAVKAVSTLARTIDLAKEMDELIVMQRNRIQKIYNKEEKMPLLFNWFGSELKTMGELLTKRQMLDVGSGFQQRLKKGGPLIGVNVSNTANFFSANVLKNDGIATATINALKAIHGDVIDVTP